ncbi:MAG: hypothetical protein RR037_05195 [Alistipes sp.]
MKKLLFFFFLTAFCSINGIAQTSVIFCGADFSLVKVRGAGESAAIFAQTFERINGLFISQGEKFDVAKYTRLPIAKYELSVAQKAMKMAFEATITDNYSLLCNDHGYDCRAQIDAQVAGYEIPQNEGLGLVIVANLLDKSNRCGSFYFVCFDIASRKVTSCILAKGKSEGAGLRNYWANSLYFAMKKYYKSKQGLNGTSW